MFKRKASFKYIMVSCQHVLLHKNWNKTDLGFQCIGAHKHRLKSRREYTQVLCRLCTADTRTHFDSRVLGIFIH